jgi:hypothetical protein
MIRSLVLVIQAIRCLSECLDDRFPYFPIEVILHHALGVENHRGDFRSVIGRPVREPGVVRIPVAREIDPGIGHAAAEIESVGPSQFSPD